MTTRHTRRGEEETELLLFLSHPFHKARHG